MIRAWLAGARAARVAAHAARGERHWRRDLHEHPDERDAFRLAQIAGLRESNAELRAQLALVRGELATYKARDLMRHALLYRRLHAAEPTEVTPVEQLHAVRPAPATEQHRRRR